MIYMVRMPDQYVAAIIKGTRELTSYLGTVPNNVLGKLEIEPVHPREYPFQLLEIETKDARRLFLAAKGAKDLKMLISTTECLENTPLIVYTIDKDFLGDESNPGADFMGMLSHKHLTED